MMSITFRAIVCDGKMNKSPIVINKINAKRRMVSPYKNSGTIVYSTLERDKYRCQAFFL